MRLFFIVSKNTKFHITFKYIGFFCLGKKESWFIIAIILRIFKAMKYGLGGQNCSKYDLVSIFPDFFPL